MGTSTTSNPSTLSALSLTINSGTVYVGGASDSAVLYLQYTNLDWKGGTFNFYYNLTAGTGSEVLFDSSGGAGINTTGTTVGITFFGTGATPSTWNVMDASAGTEGISNVAQTNPTGWTASLTDSGKIYTLTKNAPLPQHEALVTTMATTNSTNGALVSSSDSTTTTSAASDQLAAVTSWMDNALLALFGDKSRDGTGSGFLSWLDALLPA